MPSAQFNLIDGWRLHVTGNEHEYWIGVTGPQGQLAAWECSPDMGVRSEVLQQLLVDLISIAAATEVKG